MKFIVGQKVSCKGRPGTVTEAVPDSGYSVRLDERPTKEDGTDADHECDTLGCVQDCDLEADEELFAETDEEPEEESNEDTEDE